MTSASGTQRRSSGPTGAGLAFDLSVRIRRPALEVFALLADIQGAEPLPRRPTLRMVKDPSGATAVGTRWHEAVRIAPGCWLRIENIVKEMEQLARLGIDFTTRWFGGHLTYQIETTQDGCVLHHRETLRPPNRGPGGALLPWLPAVIAPPLRRHVAERLDDIRAYVESGA
jgi:hypothetical protein